MIKHRRRRQGFILLLLLVSPTIAITADARPNILVLITDDQDVLLGGVEHMPLWQREIVAQGVSFRHAFVHTPICCPSRSSILVRCVRGLLVACSAMQEMLLLLPVQVSIANSLVLVSSFPQTGNYLHNGGALDNTFEHNCYGPDWQRRAEHATFAVHAQAAGYQTSYAGKYLNQYKRTKVPPGWSTWYGLEGNSVYYDYSLVVQNDTEGGSPPRIQHHGNDYATDYLPNVLTNITIQTDSSICH